MSRSVARRPARAPRGMVVAALALASAAAGCGRARPATSSGEAPTIGAPTTAPAAPPDPDRIAVAVVRRPPSFVLDGAIAEWGPLAGPLVTAPEAARRATPPPWRRMTGVDPEPEAVAAEGPQATNPGRAGSFVAVAPGPVDVLIALDVGGAASGGIGLGIGSPPPLLPPIGEYTRGGSFDHVACTEQKQEYVEGMRVLTSELNPPEVVAACRALVERHAQLRRDHAARFARRFRVDPGGVAEIGADGTISPVPGARVAWRQDGRRATAEITLPLAALPRLSEAPLIGLELLARPLGDAGFATIPRTGWVRAGLPEPLSFAPHGALRARVFEPIRDDPEVYRAYLPPRGLSYQPADPTHVEALVWADGTSRVVPRNEVLHTPRATLGAITVGVVQAGATWVAIHEGERLVDVLPVHGVRGIFARDGAIHVVDQQPERFSYEAGGLFVPPTFEVAIVGPDGARRDAIAPLPEDEAPYCVRHDDVVDLSSRALDVLGYRARCVGFDGSRTIEVRWRWQPAAGRYVPSVRTVGATAPSR